MLYQQAFKNIVPLLSIVLIHSFWMYYSKKLY